ncbi:MAG: DinB family protein [Chloroflexi bacterium]|nr:DinB family protein [Chloroflexota bacterium]
MSQKSEQLGALLDYVWNETENFLASLPEAERVANGTWEKWGTKDVIAHLAFWQNNLVQILNGLDQPPLEQEPFEERNRKNYLNYETSPWAEVYAAYKDSFDEIKSRIPSFSDADLGETGRFPRIPNGTLQGSILGNTYGHTIIHLAELIGKYSSQAKGLALQEQATTILIEFDPSPHAKGTALYNLACWYALTGQAPRAIQLLGEAFPLRPDLVEFSKQDTDLDSLRELAEYKAFFND